MKKIFSVLIVAVLLSTMLFATGSKETASNESKKTELLLWLPPFGNGDTLDMEFWSQTLAPWASANNVNLKIEITPWGGYEEKYLTGFASGQGPDVGYMYSEMFNDFIEMGTLADMEQYFTQAEKDNYIYWAKGNMKGGQYAIPFVVGNPRIPFFNMELLKAAGWEKPPVTWDELTKCLIDVKNSAAKDVLPLAQEWSDPAIGALNNIFYPYLWQSNGRIYNEDGSKVALLDNGGAVEAAQFLYDLRFKYNVIPDSSMALQGTQVRELFQEGKVAVASMDAKSAIMFKELPFDWTFLPSFENETKAIWVATDSLIMSAACKDKELAASLIKEITKAETMTKYHKEISPFPPITRDEEYNDNPIFKDLFDNYSQFFHPLPVAEGSFKVMDTLYKNLQLMMLKDLTPEQAIKNTVDYSNSILSH